GTLERTVGGAVSTSVWIGLALAFAAGLAWLVYRRTSEQPRVDAGELVLVGGLASLVLSPITWTHHMGWVLAALPLLWARGHRLLAVASAVMMLLPVYAIARAGYLGSWYEFGLALRMLLCVAAAAVLASGVRLPVRPRSKRSVGSPSRPEAPAGRPIGRVTSGAPAVGSTTPRGRGRSSPARAACRARRAWPK